MRKTRADLRRCAPDALIGEHELRDRQAAGLGLRHQFVARLKGIRPSENTRCFREPGGGAAFHHEAAADGKVTALRQHHAIGGERGQSHSIGVLDQGFVARKLDVAQLLKRNRMTPEQHQLARVPHGIDPRLHRRGVDGVRRLAEQAEDDAHVGRVAATGRAKRTVEDHMDACSPRQQSFAFQRVREHARAAHWTDRVRTRRPDADFEDVEDGEHPRTMQPEAAV